MTKKILCSLIAAMVLTFVPPVVGEVSARVELSDVEMQQPQVRQAGRVLIVSGAVGKVVYVYNLLGVQLAAIHVDTFEKRIDLTTLPKGIYPIRIGNYTKKIQL